MSFLAIDVGNIQVLAGVMDERDIHMSCRLRTDPQRTADEYAVLLRSLIELHGLEPRDLEGGIISSVVPTLRETIREAVSILTGKRCMVVGPGLKNGLKIRIDDPAQLGSNSVANAVAVLAEHEPPAVIIDMGTATTFSVLSKKGEYIGGLLMPGVDVSLNALIHRASLLSHISLAGPAPELIGTNSDDCIAGGVIHGNAAMIDGIVARLAEKIGESPYIVATGASAEQIIPHCRSEIRYEKDLVLRGLRIIYLKNRRQ